jgi:hypothetical protein
MSAVNHLDINLGTRDVIVRAYGDEPVKLLEVGRERGHVLVAATAQGRSIGFPYENVVPFTPERYRTLRSAYESGDRRALLSAWEQVLHHG